MHRKIPAKRPKKAGKPAAKTAQSPERLFRSHPLYGEIPLLSHTHTYGDKIYPYWQPDLNWSPPLPKGAVRGNPHAQIFCGMCHTPQYFYVDQTRQCVQCRRDFVFGAAEQKFWYEHLKFNFHSTAIRCRDCRRQRRSLKSLLHGIQIAAAQLQAQPDHPLMLLAYAEALIAYHDQTGQGDLDKAISACRKARKRDAGLSESHYLEARAQRLKGIKARAAASYRAYLQTTSKKPAWSRAASQWLAENGMAENE